MIRFFMSKKMQSDLNGHTLGIFLDIKNLIMLWIHSFVQIFHVRSHAPFKIERVRSVFGFFFFALIVDAYFYPFAEIGLLAQTFQYLLPVIFRNLVCLAVRKNFRIGLERNGSAVFFALADFLDFCLGFSALILLRPNFASAANFRA